MTQILQALVSYQYYIKLQLDIVAFEGWSKLWKLNFICNKTLFMRLAKIIHAITWVVFSSKPEEVGHDVKMHTVLRNLIELQR